MLLNILILMVSLFLAISDFLTFSVIDIIVYYLDILIIIKIISLYFMHYNIYITIFWIIFSTLILMYIYFLWKNKKIKWTEEEVKYIALFDIISIIPLFILNILYFSKNLNNLSYYNILFFFLTFLFILFFIKIFIIKYVIYTSKKYDISIDDVYNFKLFYIYNKIYKNRWYKYLFKEIYNNLKWTIKQKIFIKDNTNIKFLPLYVFIFLDILFLFLK